MSAHLKRIRKKYRRGRTYAELKALKTKRRQEAQSIIDMLPKFRDRVTVGKILGISKQAVEQIEYKAVFKIKVRLIELLPILKDEKSKT